MLRYLLLVLGIAGFSIAQAQYTSVGGVFSVNEKRGCAPFDVNVTIDLTICPCNVSFEGEPGTNGVFNHQYATPGVYWLKILVSTTIYDSIQIEVEPDIPPATELYTCGNNAVSFKVTDNNYSQYVINFNDGSPVAVVPSGSMAIGTHTYATSGAKNVTVRGRNLMAIDNCTANVQPFTAVPALSAPFINQLTVSSASTIDLDFTGQPNVQYRLEIARNNSSTFQLAQNVYNTSTTTVSGLNADQEFYCFRLGAFDPCNNITVAYSNIICSADFDLAVQDNAMELDWTTDNVGLPGANGFDLQRNAAGLTMLPNTQYAFTDNNVQCTNTYDYQLVHQYSNGSRSYSLTKSGVAFSTTVPTSVQNITASLINNQVELSWDQDPGFVAAEYSIAKSVDGSPFVPVLNSLSTTITDPNNVPESLTCYEVTYEDQCGNLSTSFVDACVIRLQAILNDDNTVSLSWTPYAGWTVGVGSYTLEKYDVSGNLIDSQNLGDVTTYEDETPDPVNQICVYVVYATPIGTTLPAASSNQVTIIKEARIIYPTAFTPNGDMTNDLFKVVNGQYIVDFEIRIFNRWGEMMYTSTDINQGWNGTFRGTHVPEGTYVYVADLTDFAGRNIKREGTVVLLRKSK